MRGDVSALFAKLLLLYKEKLRQVEIISSNEIQLRYFLQSDNTPDLINLLEYDKEIFDKLDSIVFEIKTLTNEICRISGIDNNNFEKFFFARSDEYISEIKKLKDLTDKQISDLIKKRDKLIIEMEKKLADIAVDINTLKKARELFSSTEGGKK